MSSFFPGSETDRGAFPARDVLHSSTSEKNDGIYEAFSFSLGEFFLHGLVAFLHYKSPSRKLPLCVKFSSARWSTSPLTPLNDLLSPCNDPARRHHVDYSLRCDRRSTSTGKARGCSPPPAGNSESLSLTRLIRVLPSPQCGGGEDLPR